MRQSTPASVSRWNTVGAVKPPSGRSLLCMPIDVPAIQYIRLGQVGPITELNQASQTAYSSASAHVTGICARVRYCIGARSPGAPPFWCAVTKPLLTPPFHCACDACQPCGGSSTHSSSAAGSNSATSTPAVSGLLIVGLMPLPGVPSSIDRAPSTWS